MNDLGNWEWSSMMWLDVIFQFDVVRCAGESAERAVEQILVLL
jgi:hypothetical protein